MNIFDDVYVLEYGLVIVVDVYNCWVLEIRGYWIVRILGIIGVCVHNLLVSFGDINGDMLFRNGYILISEINGGYIDDMMFGG